MNTEIANVKCKTKFVSDIANPDYALTLFYQLKDTIEWEDGIKSRKGKTRKAKPLNFGEMEELDSIIVEVLNKITPQKYAILGFT